jgi:hypothetical protein
MTKVTKVAPRGATPPSPERIRAEQIRQAEADTARATARLPVVTPAPQPPAVTIDNAPALNNADEYLARNPSMIIGRAAHPNAKIGRVYYNDDESEVSPETEWTVILDAIWVGRVRLVEGEPAQYDGGLFFAPGWHRKARDELGDTDMTQWPINKFDDSKIDDPWKEAVYIPLEDGANGEMITLQVQSKPRTAAIFATDAFLRHCKQTAKRFPDHYPLVKIGMSPYESHNFGQQWKPNFQPCGKVERSSASKPDGSVAADMNDELPDFKKTS